MGKHDRESDVWSEWLLHHRHADDPAYAQVVQAVVEGYADRVLDGTQLEDQSQPVDRFLTLLHRWKAAQFPDTEEACAKSPIANYSERDLLNMARGVGFAQIHLQLHIDAVPSLITSWDVFLGSSPHPWAPSLKIILADRFTPDERQFLEQMVRPTVESGKNVTTDRSMYLQAQRPFL
jgi:hypothetical protein